eukprot:m.68663 g.68663  ORF g.68663 m.68663 type:complete len:97 (+) comp35544_c0_seq3:517-807(+)
MVLLHYSKEPCLSIPDVNILVLFHFVKPGMDAFRSLFSVDAKSQHPSSHPRHYVTFKNVHFWCDSRVLESLPEVGHKAFNAHLYKKLYHFNYLVLL